MTALDDLINDREDLLDEAEGTSGVNGQSGPLADPSKSYVATRLSDSLTKITHALSAEHLDDAGTADLSDLPTTLPGVAEWCHDHAVQAQGRAEQPGSIASYIKSIRDGIILDPGGFEALAGIT